MEKRQELYRGKAKTVYATDDPDLLWLTFRNDTSAFDGEKKAQLERKGEVNNKINAHVMANRTPFVNMGCSWVLDMWCLTFDMSGDRETAQLALGRPLDGGVRRHSQRLP